MCHYQGWSLQLGDDLGHGIGLAGTGNTQEHLVLETLVCALHNLADGFRLITSGLEGGGESEIHKQLSSNQR